MLTMVAARLDETDLAKLDRIANAMGSSSRSAAMRLLIREALEPDGPLFLPRATRNLVAGASERVVPVAGGVQAEG